jgi:hypothetical protein
VFANTLVPVVSTVHLVVRRLIGTTPSSHIECCKNLPTSEGSSTTCSTSVALRGSRRLVRYPSQILSRSPAQSSCVLHDRELATKPSRRWQPPRVTSTTDLQHEHLVPLDAISRCNCTRITHSQSDRTLASTSELEGIQALLHKPHRHEGAQQPAQGLVL